MRFVKRNLSSIPKTLISDEARVGINAIHQFLKRPDNERNQLRSPYNEKLIYNDEVRTKLHNEFYGKCAYCETRVMRNELAVDHFRPRGVSEENTSRYGHYAWLSYDWENIYLSCAECNSRKGARFPVEGQRVRPFSTVSEARSVESTILVDPCFDNPRKHIQLDVKGLYTSRTVKGSETIKLFDLNSPRLLEARKDVIDNLSREFQNGVDRVILESAILPEMPFSGAAIQFIGLIIKAVTGRRPNWGKAGPAFSGILASLQNITPEALIDGLEHLTSGLERPFLQSIDKAEIVRNYASVDLLPLRLHSKEPDLQTTIREIHIKNFKGISELSLMLPTFRSDKGSASAMMLLGENAVGKSSVLEAVALALLGESDAEGLVSAEDLLRRKGTNRQELIEPEPAKVELSFYDRST